MIVPFLFCVSRCSPRMRHASSVAIHLYLGSPGIARPARRGGLQSGSGPDSSASAGLAVLVCCQRSTPHARCASARVGRTREQGAVPCCFPESGGSPGPVLSRSSTDIQPAGCRTAQEGTPSCADCPVWPRWLAQRTSRSRRRLPMHTPDLPVTGHRAVSVPDTALPPGLSGTLCGCQRPVSVGHAHLLWIGWLDAPSGTPA